MNRTLIVRSLGCRDYQATVTAMRGYTETRDAEAPDELWLVEHPPVFTLGRAGAEAHVLDPGPVPVIRTDRGGQVTYHGPGQQLCYVLLDLQRHGLGIRRLVSTLEDAVISLLADYGIAANSRPDAPGVYVAQAKIASLGLRVRRGACYHGLSLNVDMDLTPFSGIHPCGYPGLAVTQLRDLGGPTNLLKIRKDFLVHLTSALNFDRIEADDSLPESWPEDAA